MHQNEQLISLINQTVHINEEKIIQSKAKGEFFNLIKIMGMSSSEVHTHTPIIADLLNPKGSHGQNAFFLKSFVDFFSLDFDVDSSVSLEREKRVGKDQFDILIQNSHQMLIIENKIYAGDQSRQLNRYYSYSISQNKQPILIYLSLKDARPSKNSLGNIHFNEEEDSYYLDGDQTQPVSLITLNYQNNLVDWLRKLVESLSKHPNIVCAIQQYKNLIEQMTGNLMSNKKAIQSVLLNIDSNQFKAVSDMSNIFQSQSFRGELLNNFFIEIEKIFNSMGYLTCLDEKYKEIRFNASKCEYWFKSVQKSKREKRDIIGCVFEHPSVPSFKFLVVVLTAGLHYGVISENNLFNLEQVFEDDIWIFRNIAKKVDTPWMSKYVCNFRNFDAKTIEIIIAKENENFQNFVLESNADFNNVIEKLKSL